MKKLIYTNDSQVVSLKRELKQGLDSMNGILEEVSKLKLPLPTSLSDFGSLIQDPRKYFEEKYVNSDVPATGNVFSWTFSKRKEFNQTEIPENLEKLTFMARECRGLFLKFEFYSLAGGKINMRKDCEAKIIEWTSLYAQTNSESEVFELINQIQEAISKANAILRSHEFPGLTNESLSSCFVIDVAGKARLNNRYLEQIIYSMRKDNK